MNNVQIQTGCKRTAVSKQNITSGCGDPAAQKNSPYARTYGAKK